MTPQEVEAIVGGYHGDPFRILGPHRGPDGWEIRAFLPQAAEVRGDAGGARLGMEKVHPQGFYTACQ